MEDQLLEEQTEQQLIENDPDFNQDESEQASEPEVQESDAERNLANLRRLRREEKERYERELRERDERLARYENKQQQSPLSDHEKLLKKVEELERSNVEAQIKLKHPDVDEVVSAENIQVLIDEHPEIANVLRSTPDLKDKTLAAYKFIKQLGISKSSDINPDALRAQKNAVKPRSLSSIANGNSALSHANMFAQGLTPELKESLLREMVESSKGA